jgi:hypothetical protein
MFADRFRHQNFTKNIKPNAVRLGVLTSLIGLTGVALILSSLISCKSTARTKADNPEVAQVPEVAQAPVNPAEIPPTPGTPSTQLSAVANKDSAEGLALATPDVVLPLNPNDPALDMDKLGEPKAAGGPVVGLEVWQDNKSVTSIATGKQVLFRLSGETRDTSASGGCAENPGIIQASWTIGSKPSADLQRYAGQDCRSLDYSGMFTKEGSITVRLDVLSVDGDLATSEKTFEVKNSVN